MEDLLDRGWRRSGSFLYKPDMERTCCPSYTIRLRADDFVPSKEQLRVSKRMQRYCYDCIIIVLFCLVQENNIIPFLFGELVVILWNPLKDDFTRLMRFLFLEKVCRSCSRLGLLRPHIACLMN